ncbi:MAG: hypothetical protein HOP07_02485 [Bacteriovoracaceae bacterium]|nr:hypothetical protein [Bacteriovoracaceae bacterium]
MSKLCLFLVLTWPLLAFSYEIDNFTLRYKELPNALSIIDKEVNERLDRAAKEHSKETQGCNQSTIISFVNSEFQGLIIGAIESWVTNNPNIKKHDINLDKSVYKSRSMKDKLQGGVLSSFGLNSTINLNGFYVGVDKLGHFFDQGYAQYSIAHLEGKGVEAALKRGVSQEETYLGWSTTGIKSYGDLAANYSGMTFWSNLTGGKKPIFTCKNNQWEKVRDFSFADYVDSSWDEAINCSVYKTDSLNEVIQKNLTALENQSPDKKFLCPVDSLACQNFQKKYPQDILPFIISPQCLVKNDIPLEAASCKSKLNERLVSEKFTRFCETIIEKLK